MPGLDAVRDDLNALTGNDYSHLALVLTRPPRGLGGLVAAAVAFEFTCPNFATLNALRARVLARTADGEIHEWVLMTDSIGMTLPMAQSDWIATISRSSMSLGWAGVLVVRAHWANGPGWIYRKGLRDWKVVAGD